MDHSDEEIPPTRPRYQQPHNIHFNTGNKERDDYLRRKEHRRQKYSRPNHPAQAPLIQHYLLINSQRPLPTPERRYIARSQNPKYRKK